LEKIKRFAPLAPIPVLLAVYALAFSEDPSRIIERLKFLSPLFLAIAFFLFVALFVVSRKDLLEPFSSVSRSEGLILAALLVFAFGLAFFVAPKTHRIYYDENIYLHIGQSIASTQKAQMVNFGEIKDGRLLVSQGEYNKQPNAYPFLLSLFYGVFGRSENLSFFINNLFFPLSCLLVFAIGFLLGGRARIGLYAAAVFAVIPQNILWHNTTSVEPANTFFLGLTVFIFLVFLRSGKRRLFFLAAAGACFAVQFRLESGLIFPLLAVLAFIENPKALKRADILYAFSLGLLLLLPHALHLYCFRGHPWGAGQDKFSIFYVRPNLLSNGLFFLDNKDFPVVLTAFFFVALFVRRLAKEKIMLLFWLLFFWGVFLFFYAGSYHYGADVRFVLMALPPFSLLAGIGLSSFDGAIKRLTGKNYPPAAGVVLLAFLSFLPEARAVGEEAWAARADHQYAQAMVEKLPADAIVFTHNPSLFLFWGRSAAQASILAGCDQARLESWKAQFPGGIFFHFNFWCNVNDPVQQSFCARILEKFRHHEVLKFGARNYTYILYKIDGIN
jgi:hypothetical protein